ncbi:fasciclin domain-containing protein [Spongiivirga sp. MCCC 1A20706]|uniref:fasciclin domain-containing protein n=1 Tax=Spongiivirga sp. MCCC 1A20706 TaxID=3160963 RepID=UPI003977C9AA
MKLRSFLIVALTFVFTAPTLAQIDYNDIGSADLAMNYPAKRDLDIVDIASNIDEFSTLVTALKAVGLDNTLKGKGPFTVFAPLNSGFGKLPAGTVENLLRKENKQQLRNVLTYHVVATKVLAVNLIKALEDNNGVYNVTTVNGQKLQISLENGNAILTDAKGGKATITKTDVVASNGVIHIIDAVVLPE